MAEQDPFLAGLQGSPAASVPSPQVPTTSSAPQSDPFLAGLGASSAQKSDAPDPFLAGIKSPESGQNPNQSWAGKAWDWANTPLINFNKDNQSGFIGGTEDVASGLTSPLSIGLTLGTLGAGAALRGLGLAAEELPVAIRGIKGLVDAGFTVQGAIGVAKESPRVLDALKEGDYETAKRLAVHVAAGGAMTYLGAKHASSDLGDLADTAAENLGFKVKPSQAVKQISGLWGVRNREVQEAQDTALAYAKQAKADFQKMDKPQREGTMYLMQAENARELVDRHNALAEAAGRPEEKLPGGTPKIVLGKPEIFEVPEELKQPRYDGGRLLPPITPPTPEYPIFVDGEKIGTAQIKIEGKNATIEWLGSGEDSKISSEGKGALSNAFGPSGIRQLARQLKQQHPEIETVSGLRVGGRAALETRSEQSIPIDRLIGPDDPKQARIEELTAQQNIKKTHTPEEIDNLLKAYKAAINPTPEMTKLAEQSKDMFEDLLRKAKDGGVMKNGIEKYITQLWKKEDQDNPAANRLRDEAAGPGFAQNVSMARKRTFENAFEGQLLGRKLQTADPVTLVSKYISDLGEVLANRNFKKNVLENVRASDGRPVAALSGSGRLVTDENGESAVLVNPGSMHDVRMKDQTVQFLKQAGVFDQWLENGTIVKLPHESKEIYGWNTHDYRESPSSAFEDWHYAGHGPDGTPVQVKARYNIHPEAYDYLNRLVGAEPSAIRQMKPLNWLLKASSEAKHMMLSFSPFHIAQEGLRAVMTGISPFRSERLNINENPDLGEIVEEGLTRGKEHLGLADYDDSLREGLGGRSKLLDLAGKAGEKLGIAGKPLTILRDIQNYTTEFLFDKYLPALKDRAALELKDRWDTKLQDDAFFNRLQKDHPEFEGYTKDRAAAKLAAMETNERFGGLNYKQMGRSVGAQDFLRLATLAPDWLESEMRSVKRFLDPTGGAMLRRDVVRLTAGLFVASRALNMLVSGKPHMEAPFGVAWTDKDGKEKIYSIRSLPTDMFHATTDPVGFLRGRMSPLVRSTAEAYTGRDFQGRKLTPGDTAVDIVRNNFVPIPAQAVLKGATGGSPDLTTGDQAIKAAGLTAQVYRSEAQKLANQLSSNKNETGPVEEAQLRRHRAVIDLENQIRSGQAPLSTLNDLVESGHLSQKDAKIVHRNVTETHGLDPEMAQLYSQASRLPAPDFLKIWSSATPAEQSVLAKLLIKKRTAYNQKVLKEMTPAQRTADPTYQEFKRMFPGQMVF